MIRSLPGRALAVALVAGVSLCSCARSERSAGSSPDTVATRSGTAPTITEAPADTAVRAPRFRAIRIADRRALHQLWRGLGPERFLLVLKVNRRDSLHVHDGDSLAVPADTTLSLLDLAPFPRRLADGAARGKLLLVSCRVQAWAAYDSARLVRWGPTSTGRESLETPEALYHTNWKDADRTSTFNDEWRLRWYVNLENYLGISFHQFDLPGYPASHSCVRLLADDAKWIYGWCDSLRIDPRDRSAVLEQGTPVVVFGAFAYARTPPWRRLVADSSATEVPAFEIEAAIRSARPLKVPDGVKRATLLERAARRDSTPAGTGSRPRR